MRIEYTFVPLNFTTMMRATNRMQSKTQSCITGIIQKKEIEGPYEEPYLPLMSIYMHSSGYDITFENEEQEYRASALIREYSIYDVEQKEFLRLTSKGMFRDERVLYLKYYLNGFSLNGKPGIVWVDDEHFPQSNLLQNARKGVYIIKDGKKTTEKDKRQWSFKLNEDIWLPTD